MTERTNPVAGAASVSIDDVETIKNYILDGLNLAELDAETRTELETIFPIILPGATLEETSRAYHNMECNAEYASALLGTVYQFELKMKLEERCGCDEGCDCDGTEALFGLFSGFAGGSDKASSREKEEAEETAETGDDSKMSALLELLEALAKQLPGLLTMAPLILPAIEAEEDGAQKMWDSMKMKPLQFVVEGIDQETVEAIIKLAKTFYGPASNDLFRVISIPAKFANDFKSNPDIRKETLRSLKMKAEENAIVFTTLVENGMSEKTAIKYMLDKDRAAMAATRKMMKQSMRDCIKNHGKDMKIKVKFTE